MPDEARMERLAVGAKSDLLAPKEREGRCGDGGDAA
jgi:hypothetical protein